MGTALLRSQDCLKGHFNLDAFGSRTPPQMKPYRKKGQRPSPAPAAAPLSLPFAHKQPGRSQPARSPTPPQAARPGRAGNHPRPGRKSPPPDKENPSDGQIRPKKALVMEQVRILKRGEELESMLTAAAVDRRSDGAESVLCSTNRLGPEPEILPKKVGFVDLPAVVPKKLGLVDMGSVYAGPAFFASPSPSSLPIPGFFLKKAGDASFWSDEATKALRCVLRLDELA